MASVGGYKRSRAEGEGTRPRKKPRIRKQADYHSSSDEEEEETEIPQPLRALPKSILKQSTRTQQRTHQEAEVEAEEDDVHLDVVAQNTALNALGEGESDETSDSEADGDDDGADSDALSVSGSEAASSSLGSSSTAKMAKKRNDPDAFATSISKILGTKLTQTKREDPILSRSKDSSKTAQDLADSKLEHKAKALLRAEKKQSLEKGRVKDVLALQSDEKDTGALLEAERRLKKTAQRGVVKLFNAVRAAQVKAEEAIRQAREEGVVGMQKREERVNEMSKQGFLDLISKGGTARATT